MVAAPVLELTMTPSQTWSATGPFAERALAFAERFEQTLPADLLKPKSISVGRAPPAHHGLGTGTQLGLAVAAGLAHAAGMGDVDTLELARRVGRGARSSLGIHGFAHGGFLVEAGKGPRDDVAPLVARAPFPDNWRVVLVLGPWETGFHGEKEQRAFQDLNTHSVSLSVTEALCRLVLLGMLPALAEGDVDTFGEALYDFNVRVGEVFAPIQGGIYCCPQLADVVAFVRDEGVRGVGQSSWGPGAFAIVGEPERAEHLANRLRSRFTLADAAVIVAPAQNHGAEVVAL